MLRLFVLLHILMHVYARNTVYNSNRVTTLMQPTEESSQQEVLKELGVDLTNEGRLLLIKNCTKI